MSSGFYLTGKVQIILLQDVNNVGKKGQIKNVPDGFARNFLLAKKLAALATPAAIEQTKQAEERNKKQNESKKQELQELAQNLSNKKIIIKARAKNGKLFGSITAKEIAAELGKIGFSVSEKAIEAEHLKELGEKKVSITLGSGIKTAVIVTLAEE